MAVAYKVNSDLPEFDEPVKSVSGEDCWEQLIDRLDAVWEKASDKKTGILTRNVPIKIPDPMTLAGMRREPNCHICGVVMQGEKHLDHDHLTGKCLVYAHPSCNKERRLPSTITVYCHNLKG